MRRAHRKGLLRLSSTTRTKRGDRLHLHLVGEVLHGTAFGECGANRPEAHRSGRCCGYAAPVLVVLASRASRLASVAVGYRPAVGWRSRRSTPPAVWVVGFGVRSGPWQPRTPRSPWGCTTAASATAGGCFFQPQTHRSLSFGRSAAWQYEIPVGLGMVVQHAVQSLLGVPPFGAEHRALRRVQRCHTWLALHPSSVRSRMRARVITRAECWPLRINCGAVLAPPTSTDPVRTMDPAPVPLFPSCWTPIRQCTFDSLSEPLLLHPCLSN